MKTGTFHLFFFTDHLLLIFSYFLFLFFSEMQGPCVSVIDIMNWV